MLSDKYEQEKYRKQLKQKYDRRFVFTAHVLIFLVTAFIGIVIPNLGVIILVSGITLIPHTLFVVLSEYENWLAYQVERKFFTGPEDSISKRKHYPEDDYERVMYRLSDDGEIEEVPMTYVANQEDQRTPAYMDNQPDDKKRKRYKKHRKDNTDEFDVKKLLKKIKDIVD